VKQRIMISVACVLAVLATAAGWMAASSYIALRLGHIAPDALAQPWLAWWTYATSNPNGWTKIILSIAAIPPTGAIVVLAAIGWKITDRIWFEPSRQQEMKATPLYGNSHWAKPGEMQRSSINHSKSAF
jgi:hypothetical protein